MVKLAIWKTNMNPYCGKTWLNHCYVTKLQTRAPLVRIANGLNKVTISKFVIRYTLLIQQPSTSMRKQLILPLMHVTFGEVLWSLVMFWERRPTYLQCELPSKVTCGLGAVCHPDGFASCDDWAERSNVTVRIQIELLRISIWFWLGRRVLTKRSNQKN